MFSFLQCHVSIISTCRPVKIDTMSLCHAYVCTINFLHTLYVHDIVYSGTSDSGPSEIGTQYNRPRSLQRTQFKVPKISFPIHCSSNTF